MGNENGLNLFQVLIYVASISILLFSAAVTAALNNQQSMGKTATVAKAAEHKSAAIPRIDRAAPAAFKTATFGLG